MNLKELAESLEMEVGEYLEFLELFVERSEEDLSGMESAHGQKKFQEISSFAHSIKGAALGLGLDDIGDIALKIEKQPQGTDAQDATQQINLLKRKVQELAPQVESGKSGDSS